METTTLTYFDLCAPLNYSKIENLPAEIHENDEFLLLYELDPAQSCSIEPARELILDKLIAIGQKTPDSPNKCSDGLPDTDIILPAGKYLFTQRRSSSAMLKHEEWLDMAIEQQKDGLWERYKLKSRLCVRFLYEDGLFVTQLFRPCPEP